MKEKILIVEDEAIVAEDIRTTLECLGYAVSGTVSSGEEAIELALKDRPDLILMDIVLRGEMDGIEAADQIRSRFDIPVVYLTAYADEEVLRCARITEPYGYIIKPFEDRALHSAMEIALYKSQSERALRESAERLKRIIEGSPIAMFTINREHRITHWNHACEVLTGLESSEMIGTSDQWKAFYPCERPVMADLLVDGADENEIEKHYAGRYTRSKLIEEAYEAEDFFPLMNRWLHFNASPLWDLEGELMGALEMVEDITECKKAEEQLERSFVELAEITSRTMASRDPYTAGHQRRVAELARLVGEKMGLGSDALQGLYIGGLLHDIGKISVPESILTRPGNLGEEEWALVRSHARQGYEILKETTFPWPVAEMALRHHERLDGSGYPDGLSGDELSLEVRILGACDVVEAMSSHRPYRAARSMEEVMEEVRGGRGTKYDAVVVDILQEIIENGELETLSAQGIVGNG